MSHELLVFFTSPRGVDVFWSPLVITILGGVILALILNSSDKPKKAKKEKKNKYSKNDKGLSIKEVQRLIKKEIDKRLILQSQQYQPLPPRNSVSSTNDEQIIWIIGFFLLALTIGYAKYQSQVLDYSVIGATSLLGFWMGTIIFSIIKGTISGKGWIIYTTTICILSLLALPLLYMSYNPIYSPEGISNLQQIANDTGFLGLFTNYGANGLLFLILQVVGFTLLYGSWLYILLTLIFMTTSTLVVTNVRAKALWLWLSIRTSKFGKPIKGTIVVVVMYVLSFLFISGFVYEWLRVANHL